MKLRLTLGTAIVGFAVLALVLFNNTEWVDEPIVEHEFNHDRTELRVWTERGYYSASCFETRALVERKANEINVRFQSKQTSEFCTLEGCIQGSLALERPCASETVVFGDSVPVDTDVVYG